MKYFNILLAMLGVAVAATPAAAATAKAGVKVKTELGHTTLLRNQKQKAYIRVHLLGEKPDTSEDRPPVNIAIVIDKSGSMNGEKIERAKEAAIMAVNRLAENDIVSIITYDSRVEVIAPAARVGDSRYIRDRISRLRAGGSTALYAGTVEGLRQVRNHLSDNLVNRVVLISDGLANIGPSSPEELAELGRDAGKDGIAITTIGLGLGYNEDLMSKLAFNSDGNHAFARNASDLVDIFNSEFGDVLSVIAQDVEIEILLDERVKPLRSLGRNAEIDKNRVRMRLNQIYGSQEKEFILEVEAPDDIPAEKLTLAEVKVNYLNMSDKSRQKVEDSIEAKFVNSKNDWEASTNKQVMKSVATQIAVIENERAVKLRDSGKIDEARKVLNNNAAYLRSAGTKYEAKELESLSQSNAEEARKLDSNDWGATRKMMRARQHKEKTQQKY